MLNFFTQKIRPIGLDIGHHSIKMLQLTVSRGTVRVLAAAKRELPPTADSNVREASISEAIKHMLSTGQFHGRTVVSCLGNEQLKIKSVRVENADVDEIEESLKGELAQRVGLDGETNTIKYIMAGNVQQGSEIRNEVLVFAVDNEALRSHIARMERLGLTLAGIDTVPCALFRSFERSLRRQQDRDMVSVFVDVGNMFTTVVVGRGRDISFVKQIPMGGERFNAEIADKLGIDTISAAALRKRLDADGAGGLDEQTRQLVIDAMAAATEQLTREISLCFRYFSVTFRGSRPQKAIVGGGEAYEATLVAALRKQLGLEIEIAQPLRNFDKSATDLGKDRRSQLCEWTVATGLSLKGFTFNDGNVKDYERN